MTTEEFKTGEYVVYLNGTYRIVNDGKHYILFSVNENTSTYVVHVQYGSPRLRLWTVRDAKDGDALVYGHDKMPFIFKGLLDKFHPECPVAYCGIGNDGTFVINTCDGWWTDEKVQPATKEQRDLLFQKMKEAGYEWDPHTKKIIEVTMATIDYKEKYMQALERARQFSEKPYLEDSAGIVEYIFPELKESEDGVRKALISFLKSPFVNENITDEKVTPWIAWLEKQEIKEDAERKELRKIELEPTEGWYDFIRWFVKQRTDDYTLIPSDDDIHKWGDNILNHARKVLEKSPSWSEEDQEMLNQVIEDIVKLAGPYVCYHKDVDWLKSLKDRVLPQPKQEWSEEDDDDAWLNDIISKAECNLELDKDEIDWLKSIKYRIQPQLEQDFTDDDKEQIKKISEAINNYYPCNESSEMRIWLNSIKDRIEWLKSIISRQQPKQEWSEEDDRMYNRIVSFIPQHLTAESYTDCINWLKSLRPQNRWKPSNDIIMYLERAIEEESRPKDFQMALNNLLEQLKKLREE